MTGVMSSLLLVWILRGISVSDSTHLGKVFEFRRLELTNPKIKLTITNKTSTSVDVEWTPQVRSSLETPHYTVQVEKLRFAYPIRDDCPSFESHKIEYKVTSTSFRITNLLPMLEIRLKVCLNQLYTCSDHVVVTTDSSAPGKVSNLTCNLSGDSGLTRLFVSWKSPCNSNGIIKSFVLTLSNVDDHHILNRQVIDVGAEYVNVEFKRHISSYIIQSKNYIVQVFGYVEGASQKGDSTESALSSCDGLPPKPKQEDLITHLYIESLTPTQVSVQFSADLYKPTNGEILYYSIILGINGEPPVSSGWCDSAHSWPNILNWRSAWSSGGFYQATPKNWNPFNGSNTLTYSLGSDDAAYCDLAKKYFCNGPLQPSSSYKLVIRAFTKSGYTDSDCVMFKTRGRVNTYVFLYLMVAVIVLGSLVALGCIYLNKKSQISDWYEVYGSVRSGSSELTTGRGQVRTVRNWLCGQTIYNLLEKNTFVSLARVSAVDIHGIKETDESGVELIPSNVKEEFEALATHSSVIASHNTKNTGESNCNRMKNRYKNVIPYDHNVVQIQGTYINASLIQFPVTPFVYIITQGPLEETCTDFWAMVHHYRVKIIVMLCEISEDGREKCYPYFPDLNECMEYGEYQVSGVLHKNNPYYTERQFVLSKAGEEIISVTHFHYTKWCDFGTPGSQQSIIDFCAMVQRRRTVVKPIIVHCSAGIGRSGTYIGLDLILQGKARDIFSMVIDLRRQREGMVQTLEQYYFLHKCLEVVKSKKRQKENVM